MSAPSTEDQSAAVLRPPPDSGLTYGFKPSLVGVPHEFRLAPDALEWQAGRRSGRVPYREIKHVRLLYRPANMQSHRFVAEIRADQAPTLKIVSVSWRSMMEQQRQDGPYREFVTALHRRLSDAGAATVFEAGTSPFIYWPGVALFAAMALAMAFLIARAMAEGAWAGAAMVGAFMGLFLWQVGNFFRRNRPGAYRPDSIPETLLPRG